MCMLPINGIVDCWLKIRIPCTWCVVPKEKKKRKIHRTVGRKRNYGSFIIFSIIPFDQEMNQKKNLVRVFGFFLWYNIFALILWPRFSYRKKGRNIVVPIRDGYIHIIIPIHIFYDIVNDLQTSAEKKGRMNVPICQIQDSDY
jgi:hypothetical protein